MLEAAHKEMDDEETEEDDGAKHLDVDRESVDLEPKPKKTKQENSSLPEVIIMRCI
jgi:hypothetical protein